MSETSRHLKRRQSLVSVTRRVAAKQGLGQTTVRAVAAEAELSAGSVLYYFPIFDNLIFESVEAVVEEFYQERRRIAESLSDPVERIRALIVAGVPDAISDDLRILYESIAFMREKPQYRPLMRSIVERQVLLYRSTIELGAGVGDFTLTDDSASIARNIVALEDAYDLYPLLGLSLDRENCRRSVMRYAELALGCSLLD